MIIPMSAITPTMASTTPSRMRIYSSTTFRLAVGGEDGLHDSPAQRERDDAGDHVVAHVANELDDQPGGPRPALLGREVAHVVQQRLHLVDHCCAVPRRHSLETATPLREVERSFPVRGYTETVGRRANYVTRT